jgi:predicted metalloprotease
MRYNPKARLDRSQVQVRSGGSRSGLGGGGFPIPMGVGGGVGGIIVIVVIVLLSGALGGGGDSSGGPFGGYTAPDTSTTDASGVSGLDQCETGEDANSNEQCALLADVNSVQAFWEQALPDQSDVSYKEATTQFFTGSTDTGCGGATADVGPFYCPVDKNVYLDTTFFDAMLEGQLGAKGGPFSEAYVLAHEYGHHVQDLLGTMGKVRTQQGANSDSVRLELQADCYAGMWAKFATTVEDENGEVFILDLTQDDIDRALDAAAAVGDDRIQQASSGRTNPETWTHGSAAARQYWFSKGLQDGTLESCDTFATDQLYPS